ncbi:TetR/AcrR family transcriptional regulator [Salipaludibacillus sp. HK11]|uniref:TetR/AcrR family transcriptional regulator n=1 Tax=Salipaludibacillus sp. HK11 TaxID=3394320 RepID=UPI0039FD875F
MAPRGFNKDEAQRIEEQLVKVGKDKFETIGLKKTSIRDLTEEVGISLGSFYKFFDSKELLYFRILEQEEEAIQAELIREFESIAQMNAAHFASVLLKAFKLIEQRPILYRIIVTDDYEVLVRKLPSEVIHAHAEQDTLNFSPLFQYWQEQGIMDRSLSHEVISGSLRAIFLLLTHQKEIGEDVFNDSFQFMIHAIAEKIFKE